MLCRHFSIDFSKDWGFDEWIVASAESEDDVNDFDSVKRWERRFFPFAEASRSKMSESVSEFAP